MLNETSSIVPECPDRDWKLPWLSEARKALVAAMNEDIIRILQERNYPVGFEGINMPVVSEADLEVEKGGCALFLSERAKKRIVDGVRKNLEEKCSEDALSKRIETLHALEKWLAEELEMIPGQIRDIQSFKPQGQKEQRDIEDFRTRARDIPRARQTLAEERDMLAAMRSYSPDQILALVTEVGAALDTKMQFYTPEERKPQSREMPLPLEHTVTTPLPTQKTIAGARRSGMRTATLIGLILTAAGGGAVSWNHQKESKKAKEEEIAKQNELQECLRRHPVVSDWFGSEASKMLTILQIEESHEKIEFVQKYPDLVEKYSGKKILDAKMVDLVWQKPETIRHHPFLARQIQSDWENFCLEKEEEIIELYFRGPEEYLKGVIDLFAQVHPAILLAPPESLKGHISADQFSKSNIPLGIHLLLRTKYWPPFADGHFASPEKFINAMLGRWIFDLKAKIKEQKDGFDPETLLRIGGGADADLARKISEIMNKELNYPKKAPKPTIFMTECLIESGASGFPGFTRLVSVGMKINYALPEWQQANHIITIPIGAYLDSATDVEKKKAYLEEKGALVPEADILGKKNWLELIFGQTEASAQAQDRRIQAILEKNIWTLEMKDWDREKIRTSLLQDAFFSHIPPEIVHTQISGAVFFVRFRDGACFHDLGWWKKG